VDSETAFAQTTTQTLQTDKGTFDVTLSYDKVIPEQTTTFRLEFINHQTQQLQENVDWRLEMRTGTFVWYTIPLSPTSTGIAFVPIGFGEASARIMDVWIEGILFQEIPPETVSFVIEVEEPTSPPDKPPPRPIPPLKGNISTVGVGAEPNDIAVNPTTNTIYVSNYGSGTVSVIDGSDNTVEATINVGDEPKGIAVNPITNIIYVTSQVDNTVSVIDGSDNTVIDTINVDKAPVDVAVNPTTNTIYVSNYGSGTVSVIDGSDNTVIDTINLRPDPGLLTRTQGIAVNPQTETIYAVLSGGPSVSIIDGSDNSHMFNLHMGPGAYNVAVNPITNKIYVSLTARVVIIDGSNNSVVGIIDLTDWILAIAVNPITNTIYVTSSGDDGKIATHTVLAIDGSNNRVVGTINVGDTPWAVEVNPTTNTIYVANIHGNSISVIVLDNRPPVIEKPQESVVEETPEKEPLQGIEEFVEQIDDTLGDQVSLEVNEEPIQMVEESLQGIAEFILDIGTETSKEIIEIGQSANKTLAETKQIVDQKNFETKEIVEQKGSEVIQEIGEIIPEDNQMMYVGVGVIIFIIIIAVIAVTKRKKSQPEDL